MPRENRNAAVTNNQAEAIAAAAEVAMDDAGLSAEMDATPSAVSNTPKTTGNRFIDMFAQVVFKTVESGKTFTNSDGSKTKRVGAFVAIFNGGHAGLNGNIYAKQAAGSKAVVAECSFVGARNSPALVALDEMAKAEMTAFRKHIATEYATWRKDAPATVKISRVSVALEGSEDLFNEE